MNVNNCPWTESSEIKLLNSGEIVMVEIDSSTRQIIIPESASAEFIATVAAGEWHKLQSEQAIYIGDSVTNYFALFASSNKMEAAYPFSLSPDYRLVAQTATDLFDACMYVAQQDVESHLNADNLLVWDDPKAQAFVEVHNAVSKNIRTKVRQRLLFVNRIENIVDENKRKYHEQS